MVLKKTNLVLMIMAFIQILLIINMPLTSSYRIRMADGLDKENSVKETKDEGLSKGLSLLISFLSIKQIGFVSAEETSWCCTETKTGAICQDIAVGDYETCSSPTLSACSKTNACQTGTCLDEENGICSVSTKYECEESWQSGAITSIDKCDYGCCTLLDGTKEYVRQIRCTKDNGATFDSSIKQSECKIEVTTMGACVFSKSCKFTTEEDCESNLQGIFNRGVLCSNPDLNTSCSKPSLKAETQTTCYENKVYYLDTCGNMANVYDSSKWDNEEYWAFAQSATCEADIKNDNSLKTCGDCDGTNSRCSSASETTPDYGEYACRDLNCEDEYFKSRFGRDPLNQESWCVYESYLGNSKDVVGSEYRVAYCDRGTVKIDLCENYRGKVCGESNITDNNGNFISLARCRHNEGWKCYTSKMKSYEFNDKNWVVDKEETKKENKEKCEKTSSDCRLDSIDLYFNPEGDDTNTYKFDLCVPKYTPGLEFWDLGSNSKDICGSVNQATCSTVWERTGTKYYCEGNCACLSQDYADQINDLCTSLGDCGAKANVMGVYTSGGVRIFDISKLEDTNYKLKSGYSFSIPEYIETNLNGGKQTISFGSELLGRFIRGSISSEEKEEYKSYAGEDKIGTGEPPKYFSSTEEGVFGGDPLTQSEIIQNMLMSRKDVTTMITAINVAIVAVAVIVTTAAVTATVAAVAGTITVALAGVPIIGWIIDAIIIIVAATVILILWLLGMYEDPVTVEIEFKCQPWTAPVGGDDCDKCDDDPLRPCTEYKCKSLGATCELASDIDSENPVCINKYPNDVTAPQISFDSIEEAEDYNVNEKSNGLEIKSYNGGCLQEFSILNFTLNTTNEKGEEDYARCVYNWITGVEPPNIANEYTLDGEDFSEGNFFSIRHTFENRLPFVSDSDVVSGVSGTLGERTGEANLYVRCMDYAGNANINEYIINFCVKEGPDNTAAEILSYTPKDESTLAYQINKSALILSLNEPADCKWTHDTDKEYDAMEGTMLCEDYTGELKLSWSCSAQLTELNNKENKIYIKCKDQPWISELDYNGPWTENDRNLNAIGELYTLYTTSEELKITSLLPTGDVIRGENILGVNLSATTSGGAFAGKANCRYDFIEPVMGGDLFFETGGTSHKQPLSLFSGGYNILVTCTDDAGNIAEASTTINMEVDSSAPKIVRVYKEGSNLKIVTNEAAKCYYDTNKCYFSIGDKEGTEYAMTSALTTIHTAPWKPGATYYLKCVDKFGNSNTDCAQKISPSA